MPARQMCPQPNILKYNENLVNVNWRFIEENVSLTKYIELKQNEQIMQQESVAN